MGLGCSAILRARRRRFTPKLAGEFSAPAGDLHGNKRGAGGGGGSDAAHLVQPERNAAMNSLTGKVAIVTGASSGIGRRSEEHTDELQSLMRSSYAVFCWKKKNKRIQ